MSRTAGAQASRVRLAARRSGAALPSLAALAMLAATAHVWAAPDHLQVWWGYGAFFAVVALAQGLYGAILLRRSARWVLLLGAAGNLMS